MANQYSTASRLLGFCHTLENIDDYPLMFAVLIALAVMGIGLYYVVVILEKIFAGWAERQES